MGWRIYVENVMITKRESMNLGPSSYILMTTFITQ